MRRKRSIWLLIAGLSGGLGACQSEQEAPVTATSVSDLILFRADHTPAPEAGANQLTSYLAQTLHLTSEQAVQLRGLALAQAREEKLLWAFLADSAHRQLRTIALKYDKQVYKTMTRQQYRQFAKLRLAAFRRRHTGSGPSHYRPQNGH